MSKLGNWSVVQSSEEISELLTGELHGDCAPLMPIVVVTASVEERDRVIRELGLYIDAAIRGRRTERAVFEVGELRVDVAAHRVSVSGEEISMTRLEFGLLMALLERRDRVLTRAELLTQVWHVSASNKTRTVDTHVKRIRDKLLSAGRFIQSVRGAGYRFSEAVRFSGMPRPRVRPPQLVSPPRPLALVPSPPRARLATRESS